MLSNKPYTKNIKKRNTMLNRIQVFVFFLIVKYIACEDSHGCKGDICRKSLAIPLLDNLKAPLVANLDITQFNKQLRGYITEQIKQGVEQAKKEIRGEMVELVDTFEDAHVNVTQGMVGNLSKDLNEIRRQQMQMKDRATKETEISGNLTSVIINGIKQIGRQQKDILTDVEQLKRYKEAVISAKDEKDNFTAEFKDELKNFDQQLNETYNEIQHLKRFHASFTSQIISAVQRISTNEEKVPIVNDKLRNFEGELSSIRSAINRVESRQTSMSSDINIAFSRLAANEKRVGFTTCVGEEAGLTISADNPIPFSNDQTSYNVDMSSIKSNGKFTVKISGLYLISVSIISKTNNGFFSIYDGSYSLTYGYTAEHDGKDTYEHSGTIDVVRYFDNGDVITVKPWKTMHIDVWSCLTIVKIK